ncbi:hypothetical protein KFK09_009904 [Dendrobium nobile]|uniref:Uncharacterized protein n=1 Tax=Dendrobium nobile TaxID=94219 RepID=A0A8T3BKM8_DENNO|nr:hypothetical protein KFK09_009904 [Dendrobium nobile]
MMLDSYYLNKEKTDLIEARQMSDPIVSLKLFILKETIKYENLKEYKNNKIKYMLL